MAMSQENSGTRKNGSSLKSTTLNTEKTCKADAVHVSANDDTKLIR